MYSLDGPANLPALRRELFHSENLEGEMLPPTWSALLPHITSANYIAMHDKSFHANHPALPPVEENGWRTENGTYMPVRCLTVPASLTAIEL